MKHGIRSGVVILVAAAVIFAAAGCGDTVVDRAKAEDAIKANLERSLSQKVSAVDCPAGQNVEAGATFDCTVVFPGGEREIVTLKIRNNDADLSIVGLEKPE